MSGTTLKTYQFRSYLERAVEKFPEVLRLYVEYNLVNGKTLAAAGDGQIRECISLVKSGERISFNF